MFNHNTQFVLPVTALYFNLLKKPNLNYCTFIFIIFASLFVSVLSFVSCQYKDLIFPNEKVLILVYVLILIVLVLLIFVAVFAVVCVYVFVYVCACVRACGYVYECVCVCMCVFKYTFSVIFIAY